MATDQTSLDVKHSTADAFGCAALLLLNPKFVHRDRQIRTERLLAEELKECAADWRFPEAGTAFMSRCVPGRLPLPLMAV
jgi:hypothetical protein